MVSLHDQIRYVSIHLSAMNKLLIVCKARGLYTFTEPEIQSVIGPVVEIGEWMLTTLLGP